MNLFILKYYIYIYIYTHTRLSMWGWSFYRKFLKFPKWSHPVSWGCWICSLHLCSGVRLLTPNGATCWPWVATRKVLGWDPSGWAVIDLLIEWSITCNIPLYPLLGLMSSWINQLLMLSPSTQMLYPKCSFKSTLTANSQPLSFRS